MTLLISMLMTLARFTSKGKFITRLISPVPFLSNSMFFCTGCLTINIINVISEDVYNRAQVHSRVKKKSRPEAGIKIRCDIDSIIDIVKEVHVKVSVLMCYEDDEAKKLIGTGVGDFIVIKPEESELLYPILYFRNCKVQVSYRA